MDTPNTQIHDRELSWLGVGRGLTSFRGPNRSSLVKHRQIDRCMF
jgi:hypothetical protein